MMNQKNNIEDLVEMVKDQEQSISDLDSKLYKYSDKHFHKQTAKKLEKQTKPIFKSILAEMDFPLELPSFKINKDRYYSNSKRLTITNKIIERENKRKSIYGVSIGCFVLIVAGIFTVLDYLFLSQFLLYLIPTNLTDLEHEDYLANVALISLILAIIFLCTLVYLAVCIYDLKVANRFKEEQDYFEFTVKDETEESDFYRWHVKWFNSYYIELFIAEISSYLASKLTTLEDESLQKALELKQKKNQVCTSCGSVFRDEDAFCSKCGKSRE